MRREFNGFFIIKQIEKYGGRELPIEKSAFLKENCFLFYFDLHFFLFFNLFFYFENRVKVKSIEIKIK